MRFTEFLHRKKKIKTIKINIEAENADCKKEYFLNPNILQTFNKKFNESDIFLYDDDKRKNFEQICAIMDRLRSSITYLNSHAKTPQSEEDFLVFIMHSCIVLDAVKFLLDSLEPNLYDQSTCKEPQKYFKKICMQSPLSISEKDCPTDDKFFEYFRALSMAHPFKTSRANFLKEKNETHYSPYVITNRGQRHAFGEDPDGVGVTIYSSQYTETKRLVFSFSLLKEYINSRFVLIEKATEKVEQYIENQKKLWKLDKVPKDLPPVETLKHVIEILEKRHQHTDFVKEAITYLQCTLTEPSNEDLVLEYRKLYVI